MKKASILTFIFSLLLSVQLFAQLRENLPVYDENTSLVNPKTETIQAGLNHFFMKNVTMSHSYSMSFGSVGGTYQNINAYTNTLRFNLSPRLTGRLDVSFLHSPFGQSNYINTNNNLGGEILIRNAELNYQISDKAHIKLQYQQLPAGYGLYNPYGYRPYGYNRFSRFNRAGFWY